MFLGYVLQRLDIRHTYIRIITTFVYPKKITGLIMFKTTHYLT